MFCNWWWYAQSSGRLYKIYNNNNNILYTATADCNTIIVRIILIPFENRERCTIVVCLWVMFENWNKKRIRV